MTLIIDGYPVAWSNSTLSGSASTGAAQSVVDGKDRQKAGAGNVGLPASYTPVPASPRVAEPEVVDDSELYRFHDDCSYCIGHDK